jgi:hypothetical protein
MPKLDKYSALLRTVFFLYPTEADAIAGTNSGGTGFLVAVPSKRWPTQVQHVHGITNYHVAVFNEEGRPSPVLRIARTNSPPQIVNLDPSNWFFKPKSCDLAVTPPLLFDRTGIAFLDMQSFFLNEAEEKQIEVGPADDVFMIGRFVDYDGIETNSPALRFGHISIMDAKIKQHTGFFGRSIVVDMHSRSGFSGSPVFVYRTLGSYFLESQPGSILTGAGHTLKLLGMHWGQFPESWELKDKPQQSLRHQAALITEGKYVEGLSGMTCVIPASQIIDVFNAPDLVQMREQLEISLQPQVDKHLKNTPKAEGSSKSVAKVRDEMLGAMLATPAQPREKSSRRRVTGK